MKKNLKCLIIVPVLFFCISIFGCSKGIAMNNPFGAVQEWDNDTLFFIGYSIENGKTKGDYKYVGRVMENGFFEAYNDSIGITINESSIPERVGLYFVCKYWHGINDKHEMYFTNAIRLTAGLSASDTLYTFAVHTPIDNKTTWAEIKKLFITK
jgi:hypothetical protein